MAIIGENGVTSEKRVYAEMNESSAVGWLMATYAALRATFGPTDYAGENGEPSLAHGWMIRTPAGLVCLYDYDDSDASYRHDERPADVRRYSVGGWRENGPNAFGWVVNALLTAGHDVQIDSIWPPEQARLSAEEMRSHREWCAGVSDCAVCTDGAN